MLQSSRTERHPLPLARSSCPLRQQSTIRRLARFAPAWQSQVYDLFLTCERRLDAKLRPDITRLRTMLRLRGWSWSASMRASAEPGLATSFADCADG